MLSIADVGCGVISYCFWKFESSKYLLSTPQRSIVVAIPMIATMIISFLTLPETNNNKATKATAMNANERNASEVNASFLSSINA